MLNDIPMDPVNEIVPALNAIRPGEKVIYHVGLLAADRELSKSTAHIAATAWRLSNAGRVKLVQRRIRPLVCEYIAIGV